MESKKEKIDLTITRKELTRLLIGNLILGVGVAILRVSQMGNDPFSAMNMAFSYLLNIPLGTLQMSVNGVLFLVQWRYGKKYIGSGTLISMLIAGYIVQYSIPIVELFIGEEGSHSFPIQLLIMVVAIIILSIGLACYQKASCGIAPFDYLSLGMTEHFKKPYFLNRMITDGSAFVVALIPWLFLGVDFSVCRIGIGTIFVVFGLGPFVSIADRFLISRIFKD
ncbi:MAG: DUF6198 family protein [Eubacteriales bacterium]